MQLAPIKPIIMPIFYLNDICSTFNSLQRVRDRQALVVVAVDAKPNSGVLRLHVTHYFVNLRAWWRTFEVRRQLKEHDTNLSTSTSRPSYRFWPCA